MGVGFETPEPISITAVRRMALGKTRASQGLIAVLGAFFDDSGSDVNSPVCVMGGLLGTEAHWETFAEAWATLLSRPLPGKPALTQFHLSDCIYRRKEFADYNQAEIDRVQYLFRQIIMQSEIISIAVAVDAIAWRELITGALTAELGDPMEMCFVKIMERIVVNARRYRPGEDVSVFIDKGVEQRFELWARLYEAQRDRYPELDLVTFAPVAKVYPLQGADMIATGTFHYNKKWLMDGKDAEPSPHFRDFLRRRYTEGFLIGRHEIAEVANRVRDSLALRGQLS
jgi:hypothetical protein